jgi:putative ABC transport system permease protein
MVAMRSTEIATLRAIGFGPTAVVTSVLVEALLLALVGSLLGGVLAWLGFSDFTVSTRNGGQRLAFDLVVTPQLLLVGMWWAITIGLLSGLLPAIRAARLPVARVLRGS